jgi:glycosyltransferase involved in cell wall biosynthesis
VKPLLSIAMTTCNGERYLREQLESIFAQTFQDFELVISDDVSSDKTISVIESYMKDHKNIRLFRQHTRLGVVKNFEYAIKQCWGDYIALSDQDDIWEAHKLSLLLKHIRKMEKIYHDLPLMVHSDLTVIGERDEKLKNSYFRYRHYYLKEKKDLPHILGPCGILGNTLLMNRNLAELALPFPKDLHVHDYWIALVNEIFGKRKTLKEELVQYRVHQTNHSNKGALLFGQKRVLSALCSTSFPYRRDNRSLTLQYFLENYPNIGKYEYEQIQDFIDYLSYSTGRAHTLFVLFVRGTAKRDLLYRLRLLIKILCTDPSQKPEGNSQ